MTESLLMKHNKCGYEWKTTPSTLLNQKRKCPQCFGGVKKTQKEWITFVEEQTKGEYKVTGTYINANTETDIKHKKCGNTYSVMPRSFRQGARCPICQERQGEGLLYNELSSLGLAFDKQKSLPGCVYKKPLRFDSVIYKNKEKTEILCIFEIDGRQHEEPVPIYGGEEGFEETKKRDKIKNEFCLESEIPLYRIPEKAFSKIPEIVQKEIEKLKSGKQIASKYRV